MKKGEIVIFKVSCLKMHDMGDKNIENGDWVEIIRKTKRGTYVGKVLRTEESIGGFCKKDFLRAIGE